MERTARTRRDRTKKAAESQFNVIRTGTRLDVSNGFWSDQPTSFHYEAKEEVDPKSKQTSDSQIKP